MIGRILDQIGFFVAVAFAAPVGLLGAILLTEGETLIGVVLLAIAVGMVLVQEYVMSPRRIVRGLLGGSRERSADRD